MDFVNKWMVVSESLNLSIQSLKAKFIFVCNSAGCDQSTGTGSKALIK